MTDSNDFNRISLKEFKERVKSGDVPEDCLLHKTVGGMDCIKSIDRDTREIGFIISTASVDRDGDTIAVDGWDIKRFKKNPVVLWAHDHRGLPVGKATDIKINKKDVTAVSKFVSRDISPFADTVFQLYIEGFLNATSVGFQPKEWDTPDDDDGDRSPWAVDFTKQELLEFSAVPVPSNPDALIQARSAGIDMGPVKEWAEATLDQWHETSDGMWVPRSTIEEVFKKLDGRRSFQISKERQQSLREENLKRLKDELTAEPEPQTRTWKTVVAEALDIEEDDLDTFDGAIKGMSALMGTAELDFSDLEDSDSALDEAYKDFAKLLESNGLEVPEYRFVENSALAEKGWLWDISTGKMYYIGRATDGGPHTVYAGKDSDNLVVQSLVFPKMHWQDTESVLSWAREHDWKADKADETENTYRVRQRDPEDFEADTFKTFCLDPVDAQPSSDACKVQAVAAKPNKDTGSEEREMELNIVDKEVSGRAYIVASQAAEEARGIELPEAKDFTQTEIGDTDYAETIVVLNDSEVAEHDAEKDLAAVLAEYGEEGGDSVVVAEFRGIIDDGAVYEATKGVEIERDAEEGGDEEGGDNDGDSESKFEIAVVPKSFLDDLKSTLAEVREVLTEVQKSMFDVEEKGEESDDDDLIEIEDVSSLDELREALDAIDKGDSDNDE